jgi:hypothetical protein
VGGAVVIEHRPQQGWVTAALLPDSGTPAVPSVIAYHGFPQLVLGGVTGVAVFSLSLFLDFRISADILGEMSDGAFSLARF